MNKENSLLVDVVLLVITCLFSSLIFGLIFVPIGFMLEFFGVEKDSIDKILRFIVIGGPIALGVYLSYFTFKGRLKEKPNKEGMKVEVNHELKNTTQQPDKDKGPTRLRVGMSLNEIINVLGPPTGSMGGSDVLNQAGNEGSNFSASIENMIGAKTFMNWDRPEGTYRLVIENGRLSQIYSAPESTCPAPEKDSPQNRDFFSQEIMNFLDENPLTIGTSDEFRKGQKDFDNWGSGVLTGSKEWIVNILSTKLVEIGAGNLNSISCPKDYEWQSSKLEGFTVRVEVSIPYGVLAGYYIGRIADKQFGLFGYGFNHDETESPASPVVNLKLTEQDDSVRGNSILLVALRWDFDPIGKQELRNRAAKAVQLVDSQFDKDVMDVKILVVDEDQQYVQLSVRANFRDKAEEEQMREALKKEFVK